MSKDHPPLVFEPPAWLSPQSRAYFPNVPAHIQEAIAKREAEVSKSVAGHVVIENWKVKPGCKLTLKPPKNWPPQAREDFTKLPTYFQQDIAGHEETISALVPRVLIITSRLTEKDNRKGLGAKAILKGMNQERLNPSELQLPLSRE